MVFWIVAAIVAFMCLGGTGLILRLIEGRRRFQLDLKEREARIAEAKAQELDVQQRRAELEYREALLELERFDRRTGMSPPSAPAEPREPIDPV